MKCRDCKYLNKEIDPFDDSERWHVCDYPYDLPEGSCLLQTDGWRWFNIDEERECGIFEAAKKKDKTIGTIKNMITIEHLRNRIGERIKLEDSSRRGTIEDYCKPSLGKDRGGMFIVLFDGDDTPRLIYGDRLVVVDGSPL